MLRSVRPGASNSSMSRLTSHYWAPTRSPGPSDRVGSNPNIFLLWSDRRDPCMMVHALGAWKEKVRRHKIGGIHNSCVTKAEMVWPKHVKMDTVESSR